MRSSMLFVYLITSFLVIPILPMEPGKKLVAMHEDVTFSDVWETLFPSEHKPTLMSGVPEKIKKDVLLPCILADARERFLSEYPENEDRLEDMCYELRERLWFFHEDAYPYDYCLLEHLRSKGHNIAALKYHELEQLAGQDGPLLPEPIERLASDLRDDEAELSFDSEGVGLDYEPLLSLVIAKGKIGFAQLLLHFGTDPNARGKLIPVPLMGITETELIRMVGMIAGVGSLKYQQKKEIIDLLCKYGANIDGSQEDFGAPLRSAVINADTDCISLLCEHGVRLDLPGAGRRTVMQIAADNKHEKIMALLYAYGVDIKPYMPENQITLHWLAERSTKAMRILLRRNPKIDINIRDASEKTPLHVAVHERKKTMAQLLCDHGAEINARDSSGQTPLHIGSRKGLGELVQLLCEHGADVNAATLHGETALHLSALANSNALNCLEILTAFGAKPDPYATTDSRASKEVRRFLKAYTASYTEKQNELILSKLGQIDHRLEHLAQRVEAVENKIAKQ